jgi:hypothetical protein
VIKKAKEIILVDKKWGYGTKQKTLRADLGADAGERYEDIASMYGVMNEILSNKDLDRYDSDKVPFKNTSTWWSPPDFKKDSWLQEITRRHYIIQQFSGKILEVTDREIKVVEGEIARLKSEKDLTPAVGGTYEKTFTYKESEITIRITDVELVAQKEDPIFNKSIRSVNLLFAAAAPKINVTIKPKVTIFLNKLGTAIISMWKQTEGVAVSKSEQWLQTGSVDGPCTLMREVNKEIVLGEKDHSVSIYCNAFGEDGHVSLQILIYPTKEKAEHYRKFYFYK